MGGKKATINIKNNNKYQKPYTGCKDQSVAGAIIILFENDLKIKQDEGRSMVDGWYYGAATTSIIYYPPLPS